MMIEYSKTENFIKKIIITIYKLTPNGSKSKDDKLENF